MDGRTDRQTDSWLVRLIYKEMALSHRLLPDLPVSRLELINFVQVASVILPSV